MTANLGLIDTLVLIAAIIGAIVVGLRASGKTNSVEAFLLGNRNLPWWAILGSIVATETSTATVLSLPATAFGPTGMKFLQIAFGYILGRTIVVYLLLPLFFQGKLFSAYEVLEKRFGRLTKSFSSILFLVARNLGDGLRLFLAAIVLQKLVGWPFWTSALTIGAVTILYTYFGGMRSVVWNDCIQLLIYLAGGIVTVFVIASLTQGGWAEFWRYAQDSGKLTTWQPLPSKDTTDTFLYWLISEPYSLWAGLIGGAALTLGTHGTDQMMVQRYLSARSQRDAARAVFWSAFVVLFQFALFLFIGVQLACYYSLQPEVTFEKADEVYAHFIINSFPQNTGLVGLMLAAILAAAMSTLSSSLNASASAVLNDFYLPSQKSEPDPAKLLSLSKWLCVFFGLLQIGIGLGATTLPPNSTVVSNALTIAGYSAGLLLGLFALGVLTKRVAEIHALTGAFVGLITLLTIQFVLPIFEFKVAWPWFALVAATVTYTVALICSYVIPSSPPESILIERKSAAHEESAS